MSQPLILSGMLLATAVPAMLPVTTASAQVVRAHAQGPYGVYVSKVVDVEWLGLRRQIVVAINVQAKNNPGYRLCTASQFPDTVTFEVRDPDTHEVLKSAKRYYLSKEDGKYFLNLSGTESCRHSRLEFELDEASGTLQLLFAWAQEEPLVVSGVGKVDIYSGDLFTKIR